MVNKIISSKDWRPLDGLILEDNALAAIKEKDNVMIVAGPGAGKTELLAQKACYLLQTNICTVPRKILAISFKTDAASNLKERVEKRCGDIALERFVSMTYDAFSKRILDRFRNSILEQYRPNDSYIIDDNDSIKLAFQEAGFVNTRNLSAGKLKVFYVNQLSTVTLPIITSKMGIKEKAWLILVKGNDKVKPCLTFQMISRLAEYIIRTNRYLKKALLLTYSHVFLDEFQDTTSLQYNLVKTCFMETTTVITAVGDNKQRIMLWAGALEEAFEEYCSDFLAIEKPLLMNHRSAPRLVELQKMMYESLRDESKEISCSPKWKKDDGIIKLYKFINSEQEADIIANDIIGLKSLGTELKDICILTKQLPEKYTINIINKLAESGLKARIETIYQDLLKEPVTILILNTLQLLLNKRNPESWEQIMSFLNKVYSEQIDSSYDFIFEKQEALSNFLKDCRANFEKCKNIESFDKTVGEIVEFYGIDKIKSLYPVYSQGDYFSLTFQKVVDLLWKEYEITDFHLENTISNFKGLNSIPIMTIHKSKGLEYDAVYFIGLEDSAFWNFKNQPMEDRCAFFVALSRAKKMICFTFSENRKVGFDDNQRYDNINEFYELLESSCLVEVIDNT